MSFLAPLLEIVNLDLASDAARKRSADLPERLELPKLAAKLVEIEGLLRAANADRAGLETEEEQVGLEVSQVSRDIEAAEVERYSGKRKDQDEAAAHKESQQNLREKQASLEEREMTLLEAIEASDERIQNAEAARAANRVDFENIGEAISKVEAEVAAELAQMAKAREGICLSVPASVLSAYDRVRLQAQKGGRGAAVLEDGRCGACRIKLPSLERTRMLAEPEDALIQCPQCRRVLVR